MRSDQRRWITAHFRELQGLRQVPFGLFGLAGSIMAGHAPVRWTDPSSSLMPIYVYLVSLIGVSVAGSALDRFYRMRYGQVRALVTSSVVADSALFVLMLHCALTWLARPAWLLVPALLALYTLGRRRSADPARGYYVALEVAALAIGACALARLDGPTLRLVTDVCVSGGLVLVGIADHLVLAFGSRGVQLPDLSLPAPHEPRPLTLGLDNWNRPDM